MKKYTKFIAAGIISAMLLSPLSSYGASDGALDIVLNKFTSLDSVERDFGAKILKEYLDSGESGIDELKESVDSFVTEKDKQKLEEKGYTIGDVKKEIDGLKSWNKTDRDNLVNYIKAGNSTKLSELIKKNKNSNGSNTGSTSSSGSNSGSTSSSGSSSGSTSSSGSSSGSTSSKGSSSGSSTSKNENGSNSEEINTAITFKDIENHWGKEAIIFLAQNEVLNGRSDGTFNPEGKITRAEFTSIISRAFDLEAQNEDSIKFKDVSKGSWYYDAIKAAFDNGVVNGVDETTFNPNDDISREEVVTIIIRILEKTDALSIMEVNNNDIEKFNDKENISGWAKDSFAQAIKYGIINGKSNETLAPKDSTKRAEAASIIYNIYEKLSK